MFAKEVYIRRRKALLERLSGEKGIAIFVGNVESPAQYPDNCYKWRQDSTWIYLFGIDEPRYAAIIDLESGEETIYADDVEIDDIIWMGPQPSVQSMAESVGVSRTASYGAFDVAVLKAAVSGRPVHFVPASRLENASKIAALLGFEPKDIFSQGKKGCPEASEALTRAIIGMRLVKDEDEIRELDAVAETGFEMHSVARDGIREGVVEQSVVGAMEGVSLAKGWGTSFPTILTQHGEIFHCHSHENVFTKGKLVVVDAGVESNSHYASDHTRTYPVGGRYSSLQKDIYQTVLECNELAFSLTKPGTAYRDVHLAACRHMLGNLSQLGLVKGDLDEMLSLGVAGLFMPHGLGHNMGIDVHDMEAYGEDLVGYDPDQSRSPQLGLGSLRMARRLVPGNVVTDEPGIYFIPDLIALWKKEGTDKGHVNYALLEKHYLDFGGIRLEDDVLVTADGARRLGSRRLPITIEEVEEAMSL
ncbi:MAG: aminopeptidase P N-terminal domain-containing protein [Bacteroidales bacterium]|nr:aminopeptidase P N-terminal domain-containing protein [Candidatus Cryptobacteroides equifaecalis]